MKKDAIRYLKSSLGVIKEAQGLILRKMLPDSTVTNEDLILSFIELFDNEAIVELVERIEDTL